MDAECIATEIENIIMANIVILSAAAATAQFPTEKEVIIEFIKQNLPPHSMDMNIKAFKIGYKGFFKCC